MPTDPSRWPVLRYKDQLTAAPRQELESLVSQLVTYLAQEHNEDGSHSDITGATLELTGAADIGARLQLGGFGTSTVPTTTNVLRDGEADGPRYTVYRLAPTANATIQTIFAADSDAIAGQLLVLINTSAFTVTLKYRFSGGLGDITTNNGLDYVMAAGSAAMLWFDRTTRTFWMMGTAAVAAAGDVVGPSSSVDSEIALYSGTGGKTLKRATGTGLVHATSGVYSTGTASYADIQNVSATSKFLGRKSAGAGVIEELSVSDALTMLGFINAGSAFYTGNGHPQGVTAAPVGNQYLDLTSGIRYAKRGGGSTAYGWYPICEPGGGWFPVPWAAFPSGQASSTQQVARTNHYGYFANSVGEAVDGWTVTGVSTQARAYIAGSNRFYASMLGSAVISTNTYVTTNIANAAPFSLDDDADIWIDCRTGTLITSIRIWFGLSNAVISDTDTFATASAGALLMRYSTGAGDPGWIGQSSKNGAANHTESGNAGAIALSTNYRLRIRFVRSGTPTVYFSVNDGTELALTANIPPTGSSYFPIFGFTNQAAAARTMLYRGWGGAFGSN